MMKFHPQNIPETDNTDGIYRRRTAWHSIAWHSSYTYLRIKRNRRAGRYLFLFFIFIFIVIIIILYFMLLKDEKPIFLN